MGNRDERYELNGVVELGVAFFKTHSDKETKEPNKQGRGSEGQSKVLALAKVVPKVGRPKKYKKPSAFRYVKMEVIPDSSAGSVNQVVSTEVTPTSTITSDGWLGFKQIKKMTAKHVQKVVPPVQASNITLGPCDDQKCQKEPAWDIPQNQRCVPPELSRRILLQNKSQTIPG